MSKKNRTWQHHRRRFFFRGGLLLQWLFSLLPFDTSIRLGGWIGWLAYYALRKYRRRTLANLNMAFGDAKSPAEIRRLARNVFRNGGRSGAEVMMGARWTDERMRERIQPDNAEPFVEAGRAGRGAVLLTAHFGNWELMGGYMARILGINLGVIARHLSNAPFDEISRAQRESMGMKVFYRGDSPRKFYRHLVSGGVLGILSDHDFKRVEGIFVDFFGRPAHTATGPAELISRMRLPWFIAYLERRPDGVSHVFHCEGPLPAPEAGSHQERVRRLTEDYMRRIEAVIRRYPDQWMWMHDRWRKRPHPGDARQQNTEAEHETLFKA